MHDIAAAGRLAGIRGAAVGARRRAGARATARLSRRWPTRPSWCRRSSGSAIHRLWYAEHHNMPGIASSAPEVLIANAGARTSRIRLGSGGVMLPNHAPLVVAERFGTLEALFPGRIDLGIGRAPGTDQRTAAALRRLGASDDLPELLHELYGFFEGFAPGRGLPRDPRDPRLSAPTCRRSGCSARAASAPRWRARWGCRSPSPITSARTTRCPRSTSTARHFRPSASWTSPTRW